MNCHLNDNVGYYDGCLMKYKLLNTLIGRISGRWYLDHVYFFNMYMYGYNTDTEP